MTAPGIDTHQRPEPAAVSAPPRLLCVDGLTTVIHLADGPVPAVDRLSFNVAAGETLCIVGESGCGKSMLALSLIGLHPRPVAELAGGTVLFDGQDLVAMPEADLRDIRGNRIAMIFQEPMTAFNPVMPIGRQIGEVLARHQGLSGRRLSIRTRELLDQVQIPDPYQRSHDYPHQLSGGMRQRAMIAMALACGPALLIADEPTTALDVTIQAQVLALIRQLQAETGMALILITHDLGIVAEMADRVMVMYAGRKIEEAPAERIFRSAIHPYTSGLLASVPVLGARGRSRLSEIAGSVPALDALPEGCAFAPRCERATAVCGDRLPPFDDYGPDHAAACWNASTLIATRADGCA